jgi:hypothetical protein
LLDLFEKNADTTFREFLLSSRVFPWPLGDAMINAISGKCTYCHVFQGVKVIMDIQLLKSLRTIYTGGIGVVVVIAVDHL